jgi:phosphoenolpyruvate phosphomutase
MLAKSDRLSDFPQGVGLGLFRVPAGSLFMEAHSGLSAIVAERCGFKGLWASGFSISSAKGKRDCGEVSWTQLAEVVSEMVDVSTLPILADADSGFGNYNTCRQAAKRFARAGARGMVIEDKLFPKFNSFLDHGQELTTIPDFKAKIHSTKDALGEGFCVIARTETFIAGGTLEEALLRAGAYVDAGADAVFIHSKQPNAEEVESFARQWPCNIPFIVAPTTYAATPFSELRRMGASLILCANQNMRASAQAMLRLCSNVAQAASLEEGCGEICSVADIFELLDYHELEQGRTAYERPEHGVF